MDLVDDRQPLYIDIYPSNISSELQRFGFENHFRAGGFSDLGSGLGLRMIKSSPGVHPKPRFGPILDSTVYRDCCEQHRPRTTRRAPHIYPDI